MRYASPLAPCTFASSSSVASSARENVRGTRRNRTVSAEAKTPNAEPRVSSVASSSSSAKRSVRLVRSEAPVGLGEGHPRPGHRDLDAEALAPDGREHLLHQREELLLIGEAHLGVELRDLLHAVGAQILVAEADRDLEVPVEPGDHRQLLEDLRALRQREEPPRMQPARDDEVSCAFGRRLVEDRRLDVEEAGRLHVAADDPDHLRPQPEVALELLAAKVEPPVAQPQGLVDVLLVELERQAASTARRSRARRPAARPRPSASWG